MTLVETLGLSGESCYLAGFSNDKLGRPGDLFHGGV